MDKNKQKIENKRRLWQIKGLLQAEVTDARQGKQPLQMGLLSLVCQLLNSIFTASCTTIQQGSKVFFEYLKKAIFAS